MSCRKLMAKEVAAINNGTRKILTAIACTALAVLLTLGARASGEEYFSMTYLYGNYDYQALVERTDGALDEVSPGWFDVSGDGKLKLVGADTAFVEKMHEQGIKVVPFLSNHWDRAAGRTALEDMHTLVSQLAAAVEEYGLDGINVDIENLTERDRDAMVSFTQLLRRRLGDEKIIAVAVAANPRGFTTGWHASYDYAGLAEYADYLMIMAYDEHYEGGEAGPTASLPFTEQSLCYALQYVDADKMVLGVPFYGRYWKQGESHGGIGASQSSIDRIIAQYDSTVFYDSDAASPFATVVIGAGDVKPKLGGRTLQEGTYTFWYENKESMCRKLELVDKYGILGVGSWSLGQESGQLWSYYKAALNPVTEFADVRAYEWFYSAAHQAVQAGYMTAKDGMFRGGENMTRGELVQALYSIAQCPTPKGECTFTDIDETSPLRDALAWMSENGIVNGRDDGAFHAHDAITRQDAAVILFRYAGRGGQTLPSASLDAYCDAGQISGYAAAAVGWAAAAGILSGTPQAQMMPTQHTTRAQAAAMLTRYVSQITLPTFQREAMSAQF